MKILVPVDGSPYSANAVDFVASRSTLIGAEPHIELLNVQVPVPQRAARVVGKEVIASYYDDEAKKALRPAAAKLTKAGVDAIARHVVGNPAEKVAEVADGQDVDLIVMGSHGRSALKGLLLGSVTNAVLAQTKKPMLILRTKAAPAGDALKVGIAVDGSKFGRAAVRYALKHRGLFGAGAQFSLIHVASDYAGAIMPDMAGMALPALSEAEVLELQKKEFNAAIHPLRALFAKAGVTPQEVCLVGNAGDEIAAYAKKKKLDVLVLGSHGYGAFKAAVMGSTANRVAAQGDVPLLLIREA
ncbi:MAG: universal stress protein [Burkholderiaceae bacterium]